jgi:hypothetical protein
LGGIGGPIGGVGLCGPTAFCGGDGWAGGTPAAASTAVLNACGDGISKPILSTLWKAYICQAGCVTGEFFGFRLFQLMSTMRAARPTARPALSVDQLCTRPFDPVIPRLMFFCGLNPTDPLVAREGRNILPCCQRMRVRRQDLSQIRRHVVDHTSGDLFFGHRFNKLH